VLAMQRLQCRQSEQVRSCVWCCGKTLMHAHAQFDSKSASMLRIRLPNSTVAERILHADRDTLQVRVCVCMHVAINHTNACTIRSYWMRV
jgi:hypothetical protein